MITGKGTSGVKNCLVSMNFKNINNIFRFIRLKPDHKQSHIPLNLMLTFCLIGITVLSIFTVHKLPYQPFSRTMSGATVHFERAQVLQIQDETLHDSDIQKGLKVGSQTLLVKIVTGEHKGETVSATNALSTYNSVVGKVGSSLIVIVDQLDNGLFKTRVYNYNRIPYMYMMALLFFGALLLVGRKKGFMASLGLVYTFLCIFTIFLPLILRGYSPLVAALILVSLSATVTMILLNGVSKKSLCCILGTVFGVTLSGFILMLFSSFMHISGLNTGEAESLLLIGHTTGLHVRDILYSGILITSLGAIMDIAMSIVSSLYEIQVHSPHASQKILFQAGIHVGRDIIGTMSNTLILAFTGTSLNLLILLASYSVEYNQYMNMNSTAIEITQAMAGSLALVLTVPLTAFISSHILAKKTLEQNIL